MVNPGGFSTGRGLFPVKEGGSAVTAEERKTLEAQALHEILEDLEVLEENARNTIDQCALTRAAIGLLLAQEEGDVPTKKECRIA